jgi:hypothetical protein
VKRESENDFCYMHRSFRELRMPVIVDTAVRKLFPDRHFASDAQWRRGPRTTKMAL